MPAFAGMAATRETLEDEMAKGQKRSGREPKKPKAGKKPAPVKSSFIQPASEKPPVMKGAPRG
ncbi:MAG TPA: hypothetical protein VMU82_10445 [Acetobacteraceae bacterium]|nr:hypothetical protein [Acetobacteraceae bacterium]